jgi:hypothetical protein
MKLQQICESQQEPLDPEVWSTAEQAYLKYEVISLPRGMVGFKFVDSPPDIGSSIRPNYVVAATEGNEVVDYRSVGSFAGDYLIKVAIPVLPGETTPTDLEVTEWGDQCTYFAGNPVVQAVERKVKDGTEVLILTPTEVLDVYSWDLSTEETGIYVNARGERVRIVG